MRPGDFPLADDLRKMLTSFTKLHALPGASSPRRLDTLVLQIIDSVRRVKYVTVVRDKTQGQVFANPESKYFDPLRAAIWHNQQGNYNEAFWLVFLLTHFGKNKRSNWSLARGVYGGLGKVPIWTWENICSDFVSFRGWLHMNQDQLKALGNFGNHRKYQSLDAFKLSGTGSAIGSYIEWIGEEQDHQGLIKKMQSESNSSKKLFRTLYNSMKAVVSFGRMARFDYLTMIGKLQLAPIEPDSFYMDGATGPKAGAKLLFFGNKNINVSTEELNDLVNQLDSHLKLYFGMQVLEDSLCNWQKSPEKYVHFIG
jgi:hypothetical protein